MAFKFFRKRQKLIFVIMVLLMVSFLIGFQGISMLFKPESPGKQLVGESADFKINYDMLNRGKADLGLLRAMVMGFGFGDQGMAFNVMTNSNEKGADAPLVYLLLLERARQQGIGVTEMEIDEAIRDMNRTGERLGFNWDALATQLREGRNQITKKKLRGVLARWLMVFKAYRQANIAIAPSNEQLLRTFRDINEQISLLTCTIPAEIFRKKLDKVKTPTEKQIVGHFEQYKNRQPGEFAGVEDFPFGYCSPPKAEIAYIVVNEAAISSGTVAGKTPQEQLAGVSSDLSREIIKLSEKNSGVAGADVLSKAVEELTISADNLLNRKVLLISIDNLTLDDAMKVLAEQASPALTKICFPTGQHGNISIAPDIKVSLSARNTTVAKVLEKITKQLSPKMPQIKWACFQGFNDVLFPAEGIRFFPLTAGTSGLKTQQQLEDDKLIGSTYLPTSPADRGILAGFTTYAKAINPRGVVEAGQDGRPVAGLLDGKNVTILWRLAQVEPGKSPETLTPDIRRQIVADLYKTAAYESAAATLKKVKTFDQLTATVKELKLKTIDTGLFARWTPQPDQYGNQRYVFTELKMLKFKNPAANGFFIEKVFASLLPKDLNAGYPKKSQNAVAVGLPCELAVVLAARADFRPALLPKFEEKKTKLIAEVMAREKFAAMNQWFQLESATKRSGFKDQRFKTNE